LTQALRLHFDEYAAFHTTAGNKACHSLGIPLIVLASLSLLAHVPLFTLPGFTVTLAEVVIVLFVVYYLTLDLGLAVLMLLAYAVLDAAGRFLSLPAAAALFVLGWIFQGVGHYVYEKKSPAFFRNFAHLAIGQLWMLAKAVGRA
jgi:2-hydroxy fatty acid dioxygenase